MYEQNDNELKNNGVGNEQTSSTEGLGRTNSSASSDPYVNNSYNSPDQNYRGYDYGQNRQTYVGGTYAGQQPVTYASQQTTGYGQQAAGTYSGMQQATPYDGSQSTRTYGGYSRVAQDTHEAQNTSDSVSTSSEPKPAFGGYTNANVTTSPFSGPYGYSSQTGSQTQSQTQPPVRDAVTGQTYGTYQYANTTTVNPNQDSEQKPKKNNTWKIVAAALAAVALLGVSIGSAYYTYNKITGNNQVAQIEQKEAATEAEEVQEEAPAKTVTKTDSSNIQTTTVTGQTMAVVTDVTEVVKEVMPALVMIHNNYTVSGNYFGYTYEDAATASGSGIIVGQNDAELLIATNYHVIEGADTLEVIFSDDSTIEAVVKGTASDMDLAVIAVPLETISSDTLDTIKIATLGDSDALALGEPCVAIGNALGYGQSVTTGVISALNREVEISEGVTRSFIQTDAAINPGNSGGALLNLQGEVIGINSNKLGGDTIEGMGYAIPISAAQPIIEKLMNEQTKLKVAESQRGYIGISGVSVSSDVSEIYGLPQGVYVAETQNGGGAEAAGIQKGDVITSFDGEEITSMEDLQNRLQYYAAGTTVTITVMRQSGNEYVEETFDVTLGGANSGQSGQAEGDSNGASGHYDGQQMPGKPEDKSSGSGHQRGGN